MPRTFVAFKEYNVWESKVREERFWLQYEGNEKAINDLENLLIENALLFNIYTGERISEKEVDKLCSENPGIETKLTGIMKLEKPGDIIEWDRALSGDGIASLFPEST
jgi:hypothetical protein